MDFLTFIAVADARSFSRAADELHLTQPAISKRISQLEDDLSVRLFDRIGKTVTLTEAGSLLYPRAKRIVDDIDDARRELLSLTDTVSGRLAIATSHHIGLWHLPALLRRYTESYPHVTLDLHFDDSEAAHDDVAGGARDIALVTLAPTPVPRLASIPLWQEKLVFMCSSGHDLARRRRHDLATMANYAAVLPDLTTYTGRIVQGLFERAGFKPSIELQMNYLEIIRMLIAAGIGWSVLPASMQTADLTTLNVRGFTPPTRTLGIVYHEQRSLSNAAQAFIDIARNE